ncbi:MAG: hypothetical protein ACTSP1_05835 [Candidatus Freyarchaeota archaeon]
MVFPLAPIGLFTHLGRFNGYEIVSSTFAEEFGEAKDKVDVLTYNSIHPLLRDHILREQEVFYEA